MDLKKRLEDIGQSQLLRFENELTEEQRKGLYEQIEALDFSIIDALTKPSMVMKRGEITPLEALTLDDIEKRREEYTEAGVKALKDGKIGAVLLAGGMGTRLGSDLPKGVYNIGVTKELYIFECLMNNLMDVTKSIGAYIHLFVMTSDLNHETTVSFFEEKNYFGYPKEYVCFFKQAMAPCCDKNGNVLLERKDKVAVSPNGNGGWFSSMIRSNVIDIVKKNGIEWLNIFAVDNVLQRICDPVFVGATILENSSIGAKVVRKNSPDEKVGVMCLEDGRPSIIEYYEMTETMRNETNDKGERVYNFGVILNYLFKVSELERIVKNSLSYHVVEKKVAYVDSNGNEVHPETVNGRKFEQLVLDMIHMSDSCLPFEVVREKEFAPIKNKEGVDSVESARALLKLNNVEI